MKKSYTKMMMVLTLSLIAGLTVQAQDQWSVHSPSQKNRTEKPAQTTEASEIIIGHCNIYDQIWPYDGISLSYDARVGIGAALTRDMYEKYIGNGIITAMYVGWDDEASTAEYECFVRDGSFNGENLATGSGTVKMGWNRIELTPVPVQDIDRLCVGFYTDVKKDVCSIPKLSPSGVPNSIFLFSGETNAEGKELWYDMHLVEGMAKMPIMLVISDPRGKLVDLVSVSDFRTNTIVWREDVHNAQMTVKNVGSNNINNLKISSIFNDDVMGNDDLVELDEPLEPNDYRVLELPIYCLGTGVHKFAMTEVNGNKPISADTIEFELIGVPWDIEGKYKHRPLLEFFCSEENYMYPTYWDEMFYPGFRNFESNYTLVMPHVDDKYMTGDNDAIVQMLTMVDNDSMRVLLPSFTINRQDNLEYMVADKGTIFFLGIPLHYPDDVEKQEVVNTMYRDIMFKPTFASVDIASNFTDDLSSVNIDVTGAVEEGVLPVGESLYLTVYLMERNVVSYDQLFWGDKEGQVNEPREYVHRNIIRDVLTDMWGDELAQTGGDYSQSFTVELDPDWNKSNLYIAAFLSRSVENPVLSRNVINSAEGVIGWPNAIYGVEKDQEPTVTSHDGMVYIDGESRGVEVYNLAGTRLENSNLADGVYLVKKDNVVAKVLVR